MYNLLIIEDDFIYSHFILNSIGKEIQNVRIYNVVSTGKEAINIIREGKVDIIIMNFELPDMSGQDIIDFISKNNMNEYKLSIIIHTNRTNILKDIMKNEYIFGYFSKANCIDFLLTEIKNLVKEKQNQKSIETIEYKIKNELKKLKLNFSYVGTKYLYECICECYYRNIIYDINLNKDIYPIISKKYNKRIDSIKSNISKAITLMYYENEEKYLSNYFGYDILSRPKTKDIITKILFNIKI